MPSPQSSQGLEFPVVRVGQWKATLFLGMPALLDVALGHCVNEA
jgi:hypothetical protein